MEENVQSYEMIVNTIEKYSMLQRIKQANQGENPVLDYEIKVCEAQLHSLGVSTEDLKLTD